MKYILLSPHLDDTTLSCGGLIAELTESGAEVVVLCIMAGDPPEPLPNTPLIQELHARWKAGDSPVSIRRQEEINANRRLGVEAGLIFLDLPDCIYRTYDGSALYPDGEAIFGTPHPDDPAHAYLQKQTLPDDAWVVAPAGVGNHVDHQIVRDWALAVVPAERLLLYEDYPYAHDSDQINLIASQLDLKPQTKTITPQAFQAKYEAILCYASQISTFWRSDDELHTNLLHYMHRVAEGHPSSYKPLSVDRFLSVHKELAERYWQHQSK